MLSARGNDPTWIFQGLASKEDRGISVNTTDIQAREVKYGNNKRYTPPLTSFC
jgi:hypothetical protein